MGRLLARISPNPLWVGWKPLCAPSTQSRKQGQLGREKLGLRNRAQERSWLTPGGAWGTHVHHGATCEPATEQRDARNQDLETTTNAATKPGGWQSLGRQYLLESAWRTRTRRGSERGTRFGPQPSLALRLPAPRPGLRLRLRLALAAALARQGWVPEETEPRRAPRAASRTARPLPLDSAPGAWPQRAQLPLPLLHASWAQRQRWQSSLRRFLRSGDRGQDLQASKDREEKSYRSVTRLRALPI